MKVTNSQASVAAILLKYASAMKELEGDFESQLHLTYITADNISKDLE